MKINGENFFQRRVGKRQLFKMAGKPLGEPQKRKITRNDYGKSSK